MNLWKVVKRTSFKHLFSVVLLSIKNPLFVWPTIRATRKTVALSYKLYNDAHHVNGPENAFRHALWNYLIARQCSKWTKNREALLTWTMHITDWHEQAFQNADLAKKMDLHNNAIGRKLYEEHPNMNIEELMKTLQKMTLASVLVTSTNELERVQENLAHIIP